MSVRSGSGSQVDPALCLRFPRKSEKGIPPGNMLRVLVDVPFADRVDAVRALFLHKNL
jgi:hypothetical protein